MERWERMKEVFELLGYNDNMTVRELSDELDIDLQLADNLLRHYNRNGYLTRYKDKHNENRYRYEYSLTKKGIKQLGNFLENNNYIKLRELYEKYREFLERLLEQGLEPISFKEFKSNYKSVYVV